MQGDEKVETQKAYFKFSSPEARYQFCKRMAKIRLEVGQILLLRVRMRLNSAFTILTLLGVLVGTLQIKGGLLLQAQGIRDALLGMIFAAAVSESFLAGFYLLCRRNLKEEEAGWLLNYKAALSNASAYGL